MKIPKGFRGFALGVASLALFMAGGLTVAAPLQTTVALPQTTAAPAQTAAAPAQTIATPPQTTVAPAQTAAAPAQTTATPAQTTASPPQTAAPAQASTVPAETIAAPAQTTPAPAQTAAAPAPKPAAPAQTIAAPAQTTAAPAQTIAAPAQTIAAPAQTIAAPAQTTAAPPQTAVAPPHPKIAPAEQTVQLQVDAKAKGTPFPHFWEQMFGSGRAVLSLREDYRKDLDAVHDATGFQYVRFHDIFGRDVGLVQQGKDGKITYNFSYVDQIYDGLLAHGVKPFVELSFMPRPLSSDPSQHQSFWYHPNVMPPKSYAEWDAMIRAFAKHLVKRYGIDEVASWYFEVWNEPNLDFWGGVPRQASYFTLYDNTARALKSVSPRIRVGGPATAQAAWVPAFLAHLHKAKVPIDFVSSHVYGDDTAENVLHKQENIPRKDMVCDAVAKVHKEILASPYPKLPLIFSEYNASYANLPNVTDTVFMGPWLANTIRACAGNVEMMSYWTFSDVFEEQGVPKTPFYGGFGLIAEYRIDKPAFNAFAMLHRLGEVRLPLKSGSALATRRTDGALVLALWNYAPPVGDGPTYTPGPPKGTTKHFEIRFVHLSAGATATVWRLDATHGNVIATFDKMGRPAFPSRTQIEELRAAGHPANAQQITLSDDRLALDIPPQGLVVVEVKGSVK